ncbi:MAG: DUF2442 domain-containing protein [Gemmatimonadota bacterium]
MNPRITEVAARTPYVVELSFTDGSRGTVDLAQWIRGSRGVFATLQDPSFFAQVSVDRDAGTIVWPNGADLDPDVLYEAAHAAPAATKRS